MTLKLTNWWMLISLVLALSVSACAPTVTPTVQWIGVSDTPQPTAIPPTMTPTQVSVVMPSPTPTPQNAQPTPDEAPPLTPTPHHCWANGGYLEEDSISTTVLEFPLEFRVYLPPCYYHQTERYFPVLYLFHGLYSTDIQWVRMGVTETAARLMGAREIPQFIIIMPRDRDWSLPPDNKFGEMIISELVPWIDSQYRTIPGHEFRAIGGLSRGGNWAIHLGLRYWGMFGAIGAHSAPVFYTDGLQLSRWLNEIPPERMPRIFLDIGENDGDGDYFHKFEEMLSERGIPHEWHLNSGTHNEEYWSAHLEQYLRWYSEAWGE
ncbi:MAG: alpha/beta hydrolase-fold protein [Chloroflexota bacterium]|nr:alpha/beta hydrolase-fold protein [Chloroflexota bacterium]